MGKKNALKMGGSIWTPFIFLFAPLFFYTVFIIYPTIYSFVISLYEWDGLTNEKIFVGLRNYAWIFRGDEVFGIAFLNNVRWTILALTIPVMLGLVFALIFHSGRRKGIGILRSSIFFPSILAISTVGLIWRWMYDPNSGLVSMLINALAISGYRFDWYASAGRVINYVFISASWSYTGICMIYFLAGLKAIPESTIESAKLDGANSVQRSLYIVIPQLKNTLNTVVVFTLINSFKVFDIVFTMTGGGPGRATNVLASWSYYNIFRYYKFGAGSALAWVLTFTLIAGSAVVNRLIRAEEN